MYFNLQMTSQIKRNFDKKSIIQTIETFFSEKDFFTD